MPVPNEQQLIAPQNNKPVFLIGMPGAGKTYWGQKVAAAFGLTFCDLDFVIENQTGKTITQLFDTVGDLGFRQAERDCMLSLNNGDINNTIIACGGGTPCFYDNMNVMKAMGKVVYLYATPEVLAPRLKEEAAKRPLLVGQPQPEQFLTDLLSRRQEYYRQAHYILQVTDITVDTFAKILNDV
jgi:shikimate kinase